MKTFLDFSTIKPLNPDIVSVRLLPETDDEKRLLSENKDTETIELYYHRAVNEQLPGYVVLRVVDMSLWPHAAQLLVQKTVGIG